MTYGTRRFKPPSVKIFRISILITGLSLLISALGCTHPHRKAREAEVKSNIHAIQIALERYAVDSGGYYPYILYGGDESDTFVIGNPDHNADYDALIAEGYLAMYPTNPMAQDLREHITTDPANNGFASLETTFNNEHFTRTNIWPGRDREYVRRNVGGQDGSIMWDVSEGQRHAPWPVVVVPEPEAHRSGYINPVMSTNDPDYNREYRDDYQFYLTPGNFYYYALFEEGSGYSSFDLNEDGTPDFNSPQTSRPIGFHLAGYGQIFNPANDVYNLWGDYIDASFGTVNEPYTDWDGISELYVGPDGRRDGVIIVVDSGVEVNTPAQQPQGGWIQH